MIMSSKYLLLAFLTIASTPAPLSHPQTASKSKPTAEQQSADRSAAEVQKSSVHQSEGERLFEQNCSRCHNAPDGFSSRISQTVLHHMRVRASLSKHDEEELLRFLNP
jgi:cytochrome c5